MALIRATCSECGDVELRSRDLQVRICGDTGDGTYLFRCPVCRMTEVKHADDQVIDILHATRPADPAKPVMVAGDPETANRKERLEKGIPVPEDLMTMLQAVAANAGVPFTLNR